MKDPSRKVFADVPIPEDDDDEEEEGGEGEDEFEDHPVVG